MDLEMRSLQAQGGKTAAAGGQPLGTRGLRSTALTLFELTPLGGTESLTACPPFQLAHGVGEVG